MGRGPVEDQVKAPVKGAVKVQEVVVQETAAVVVVAAGTAAHSLKADLLER